MRRWAIPGSIGVSVSVLAIAIAARTARADPPEADPREEGDSDPELEPSQV